MDRWRLADLASDHFRAVGRNVHAEDVVAVVHRLVAVAFLGHCDFATAIELLSVRLLVEHNAHTSREIHRLPLAVVTPIRGQ